MLSRVFTYQQGPQVFLTIIQNKPSYFIDEYIDGKVEISSQSQIILNDIFLSCNLLENWTSKSSDKNDIGETYNETLISMYLDIKKKLKINTNLVSLSPGKFIFPFYFKIPKNVAPCFEYQTNETKASIKYTLNAQVISPYIHLNKYTYLLLKSRPIIEKKNLLFTNTSNIHKWGIFSGGSTVLNVSILNGVDCFKNNENINLNIEVDNTKGKINAKECKVKLNANLNLKAKNGNLIKEIKTECFNKIVKAPTKIKEKKNFSESISLKELNNNQFIYKEAKLPYANIPNISYFLPYVKSYIVECNFEIKVTLYFNEFVKKDERPRIIIPIFISHQSVEEFNNEISKFYDNQNKIYQSQINNNEYNSNQLNNINNNNQNNTNQYIPNLMNNINDNSQYNNNQYNPNQINDINNNCQYNNISQPQINKSMTLNNNSNSNMFEKPFSPNENAPQQNDDLDLPSQEEVEKPQQDNESTNLGAPSFDAPSPAFPPNP